MQTLQSIALIIDSILMIFVILWLGWLTNWVKDLSVGTHTPQAAKTPSKPLFKPKEPKETEEQRRQRILDENIENYDGTGKGQVKI
jgi:hypothetical protein